MAEGGAPSSAGRSFLPEIRIVLLGVKDAGKSSSGNTILGRDVFQPGQRSAVCVKKQGEVAGRQVTVVETPGWFRFCKAKYSAVLTKTEIELSQRMCGDGPHCFLIVIPVNVQFTEKFQQSVLTHLDLLSWRVWHHTMVLFTHGDVLGDKTIEEHINYEGEHLQRLIDKCGNRYHILDNHTRNDVTELLEKIEAMVAVNNHFKVNRDHLLNLQTRHNAVSERARGRQAMVQRQRECIQQHIGDHQLILQSMRIVLLGHKGTGKTTARNTILGQKDVETSKSRNCVKKEAEVAGRELTVVQAPGWFGLTPKRDTLEFTKKEIVDSTSLCPPGPHAVLLVLQVNTSFTNTSAMSTQEHVELLGRNVWDHTMVLFTYGDWLGDTPIEEHIESEGKDLQVLVKRCGNRYHVLDKGDVNGLLQKIEEMVAKNNGRHLEVDKQSTCSLQDNSESAEIVSARNREMYMQRHRQHLLLRKGGDTPLISEYRVVILGSDHSGKKSSGNTMLRKEVFDLKDSTVECLVGQGEVAGRQLTVVIAPGWRINSSLKESTDLAKQEILRSVSMCAPGPHAVLLTLNSSRSLSNKEKRNIEEHMTLLDTRVWHHTIVLFKCGDFLGDTTIEQIIESEQGLKSLVEKCGERYHVFNNCNRDDACQVTELLDKIDDMVGGNAGHHYELNVKATQYVEKKTKQREEDIESRKMAVHKYNRTSEYVLGDIPQVDEIGIVLLGCQGSGKSSSGNTILAREVFDVNQHSIEEEKCRGRVSHCVKREGEVFGRRVTVVEAPGWKRNNHSTFELTKNEIAQSASLCPVGPCVYALVIHAEKSDIAVQEHLEVLGKNVWNRTMVIFSFGDRFKDKSIEQLIDSQRGLKSTVKKCGNRYHVLNNKDKSNRKQVTELLKKLDHLLATTYHNELTPWQKESDDDRSTSTYLDSGLGSMASAESDTSSSTVIHSTANFQKMVSSFSSCPDMSLMESELRELELDNSAIETHNQIMKPTNCCATCDHIDDTSYWVMKEPSVSMRTAVPVYKHRSPPGSFECTVSGLRWVCEVNTTLEYNFSDPDIFREELAMLQYTAIGPLMDIKVMSGELSEAHLPHFACLDGSDEVHKDAVRILHASDDNVTLETCELTRFHAKIVNPSFSLTEVLVKLGIPMKAHLEVLMYRTRVTPLVLLMYVVPRDASMIQAVEKDARDSQDAKKIRKHRPDMSIWMNTRFGLHASLDDAKISPLEITLKYIRPPDLFQVFIRSVEDCFDLELESQGQCIWKATIEPFDYSDNLGVSHATMAVAASGHSEQVIRQEDSKTTTVARTIKEEGKFAFKSNTDRLSLVRPHLIKRTSRAVLKGLLDDLKAQRPPVVSSTEAEEILQRSSVLQDQVRSLIDMLLNKGEKACGIMFSLLRELDSYLYEDLGL